MIPFLDDLEQRIMAVIELQGKRFPVISADEPDQLPGAVWGEILYTEIFVG